MGRNVDRPRAWRFWAVGATAWVVALMAPSCATPHVESGIDGDLFAADGVALRAGSDPQAVIRALLERSTGKSAPRPLTIDYPLEGSVFPPEIVGPTFLWHDSAEESWSWLIDIAFETTPHHIRVLTGGAREEPEIDWRAVTENNAYVESDYQASAKAWTPGADLWRIIKELSEERDAVVTVLGIAGNEGDWGAGEISSRGSVSIRTSRDPVDAMVFYRDVPLMPTKTREGVIQPLDESMFPLIQWRLRDLSEPSAPVVLTHLPTCGNCHTFSADGKTFGMDMDGPAGDKGAYVLTDVSPRTVIDQDDVFTWNDYPGKLKDINTFGLFSRVSPDGRYVVTMVNEELFVTNYPDILFQQTFYPTRGILVVYDRQTGEIDALPGADDPEFVQANPAWSPDQETIVFLRAKARPSYSDGPSPTYANDPLETRIQYDVYRVPFRGGKGGTAEPVRGASANGMSNSFPRFSPDGKWIVFVQAKNGLLLRPDSKLYIIPAEGGEARLMNCNTDRMNSYHSWSPNSRWLAFSSKVNRPFTQLFLTHVDDNGLDTPPILVPNSTADNRAVNLPELVKLEPGDLEEITTPAVDYRRHLDAARVLEDEGDIESALAEFDKSLDLKADYWETHLTLANLLLRQGKPEEAIEHYDRTLELNPRYFLAHKNIGLALTRLGRYDEAREHLATAVQINPRSATAHSSLGDTLVKIGDVARAGRHYEEALRLDPDLVHSLFGYGRLLLESGKVDDAVRHLTQAVELDSENPMAHHYLGLAMTRQRRFADALAHYGAAIRIDPDYHPAYDSLARLRAAHEDRRIRDGREAVRLAEAACAKTGFRHDSYLQTLAMAYAADGRFEEAVATAERALELARRSGKTRLVATIESQLALFRDGRAVKSGR